MCIKDSIKEWVRKIFPAGITRKDIFFAGILVLVTCFLLCSGGDDKTQRDANSALAYVEKIQQVNQKQGLLCVMKMNLKTTVYGIDKMTRADLRPYKIGYVHSGDVDIVVDLSRASVERVNSGEIVVLLPDPEIDSDTLNINPSNLKQHLVESGWRTIDQRTAFNEKLKYDLKNEIEDVAMQNFQLSEARTRAEIVVKSLYSSVMQDAKVRIQFFASNKDVNR